VCVCVHACTHKKMTEKMHTLITLIFAYYGDKIKEVRDGRICSMHGIGKKVIHVLIKNSKGKRPQGQLFLDKRIILS
jgi:hypothetical protein